MKISIFLLLIIMVISFTISILHKQKKVFATGCANTVVDEDVFARQRKRMVEEQIISRGIKDKEVLDAMATVPRHLFVPEGYRAYSYYDQPLPIGFGQTISQPYIVAFMTELLALNKDSVVLEVGTGSGYQAAVLSRIAKQVYTMEVVEPLGKEAAHQVKAIGYSNVEVKIGDGYKGWPEHAPFDAIIVTAAADHIPQPLIDQLSSGGRMVIPVGGVYAVQDLMLVTKDTSSKIVKKSLIPVRFVPLTRK